MRAEPWPIRQLSQVEINRIAAGEVIERPASAIKELVENAIDAGSTSIEVIAQEGGLSLLRVSDDGCGMDEADLALCVERHATSKLAAGNLQDIRTLGFRGEALPSLGSVGRLRIVTRHRGATSGLEIAVEAGKKSAIKPAAARGGTVVEVHGLFSATPARLKFMKSERAENTAIADVVKRLALACPQIGFSLTVGERASLSLARAEPHDENAIRQRLSRIMGREFAEDAEPVRLERDGFSVAGFAGLPTLNRPDASLQYLFVNGRPVKDRLLLSAIRGAYQDFMPRGRYPLAALFLNVPVEAVDVNVHPAKAEVRFREASLVRGLLVSALHGGAAARGFGSGGRDHGAAWACCRSAAGELSIPCAAAHPAAILHRVRGPDRLRRAAANRIGGSRRPRARAAGRRAAWQRRWRLRRAPQTALEDAAAPAPGSRPKSRLAPRAPSFTRPTSFPKPRTASSSWTSTPPTSASSTRS